MQKIKNMNAIKKLDIWSTALILTNQCCMLSEDTLRPKDCQKWTNIGFDQKVVGGQVGEFQK
jgi:hypothetical protein